MSTNSIKACILAVDDTPENLQLLMKILTQHGYDVRIAPDGTLALAFVQTTIPDLILLDVKMPEIDGYEVCRQLKANRQTAEIPVIFLSALQDVAEKIKGLSVGAVDYITKPFQPEEVLARIDLHLTLKRLRDELYQKNIELEHTNKDLQEFASIVSHDLKAPLRGIHNLLNWFVTDYAEALGEQGKEMVELLSEQVMSMHHLIDSILKYSKAGRFHAQKEPLELNMLINEILQILSPPEHIHVIIENELPCIIGSQTGFYQIFQNLLSNAINYMDKAEGEIRIRCVDADTTWKFSVADNGPGIEAQHFEKIFRPFQSVATRPSPESSGIGLAIVKKLVEASGGDIWLESVVGQGSTFSFSLPKILPVPSSAGFANKKEARS